MARRSTVFPPTAIIAQLILSIMRLSAKYALETEKFGSAAGDMVLVAAVFVGHAEGKPMTAAKLAEYAGMPRPTVVRKLRELAAREVLSITDGRASLHDRLTPDYIADYLPAAVAAVQRAARELSKMDSDAIG